MEKSTNALQLFEFSDPETHEPVFTIQARGVVQALARAHHVENRLRLEHKATQWTVVPIPGSGPHLVPVFADAYFWELEPEGPARCH